MMALNHPEPIGWLTERPLSFQKDTSHRLLFVYFLGELPTSGVGITTTLRLYMWMPCSVADSAD